MYNSSVTPWTVACQTPLSIGFPRQEYWSGLPIPSPGELPDPGIKSVSPALQVDSSHWVTWCPSVQSLSHVRLFVTHESHHARPPCPSPASRVYSNSCPSSRWCHPAISSSVVPFSSCPQSVPASGSFSNELTTSSNPNNFPFFSKLKPKVLLMVIEIWEYLVLSSRPL